MSAVGDRTPYDGQPFYCEACGMGLAEFYACEEPDCLLETPMSAIARKQRHDADFITRLAIGKAPGSTDNG